MARLQILELPTEHVGDDMTTPFILVIDQASENIAETLNPGDEAGSSYAAAIQRLTSLPLAEQIGARAVLVFEDTIDIPANQVTLDDGQTMRLKVEPDPGDFSEKIETAIADANKRLVEQLRAVRRQEAADG